MAMLSFDIRVLEARAESVDGVLDTSDPVWEADDTRPVDTGVQVTGRLSAAGHGRFYLSGRLEGAAVAECRRCLSDVTVAVSEDVHMLFAESGLDDADEQDVFPIPAGARELDIRSAVREEWLLAVPAFALCRDDCQGFCATCGADRNTGACSCAPSTDPRWAGLRDLRGSDA
ncbi:MAG: hypothetical protein RL409_2158 [Gemmatimonadota bacterium]|mgnify:FL=1|jgi:uncharacterized protein